jgi:hypothetical protein
VFYYFLYLIIAQQTTQHPPELGPPPPAVVVRCPEEDALPPPPPPAEALLLRFALLEELFVVDDGFTSGRVVDEDTSVYDLPLGKNEILTGVACSGYFGTLLSASVFPSSNILPAVSNLIPAAVVWVTFSGQFASSRSFTSLIFVPYENVISLFIPSKLANRNRKVISPSKLGIVVIFLFCLITMVYLSYNVLFFVYQAPRYLYKNLLLYLLTSNNIFKLNRRMNICL